MAVNGVFMQKWHSYGRFSNPYNNKRPKSHLNVSVQLIFKNVWPVSANAARHPHTPLGGFLK
jgi:hypothetical protein